MDEKLIAQIQDNMNSKSTEELLDIIEENNRDEWSEQAFEAMRRILKTRDVKPPSPLEEISLAKEEITSAKEDTVSAEMFTKKLKEGYKWETQHHFYSDFHNSLMGKLDVWAWIYGIVYPILFIALAHFNLNEISDLSITEHIKNSFYLKNAIAVFTVVVGSLSFFFRQIWARKFMYFIPFILPFVFYLIMADKLSPDAVRQNAFSTIGNSIIPLIIYYFATNSTRNRLFFRLQVSESKIIKYWMVYSNKQANQSAWLSFLSPLFICGVFFAIDSIIGFELSRVTRYIILALLVISAMLPIIWFATKAIKKVNLDKVPPVGGKANAIFAIVIASIWIVVFLFIVSSAITDWFIRVRP